MAGQAEDKRYVILNADEGEPGTFKDREVLLRRPDLVLEGLAIAAEAVGAREVYLYLRGEWEIPWGQVEDALARFEEAGAFPDVHFHMHAGHGAYICGEETALHRSPGGQARHAAAEAAVPRPNMGLWGKPTLVHNVETIACVPAIMRTRRDVVRATSVARSRAPSCTASAATWQRPGTYELPLGVLAGRAGRGGRRLRRQPEGLLAPAAPRAPASCRPSERHAPAVLQGAWAKSGSMLGSPPVWSS